MEISTRDEGDTKVVVINGELDTNTSPVAEGEINRLLDAGANKLLINFEQLTYISSSGLRLLLATAKRLKSSGGDIKVCALNEMATEVFELSGFSSIINVYGTEQEALGA